MSFQGFVPKSVASAAGVLSFAFIVCLGLGAVAQGAAAADWGQEFPVSVPAVDEFGTREAHVVADDGGNFTYVWEQDQGDSGADVLARVARHDGTLGPIQTVAGAGNDSDYFDTPAVSIGSDGVARVAWVWWDQVDPCSPNCAQIPRIQFVTLDADGKPSGPPVTIDGSASSVNDYISSLALDTSADNGSTLVWRHTSASTGTGAIKATTVTAAGTPSAASTIATAPSGSSPFGTPTLSRSDSGISFVGWPDHDTDEVRGRMITPAGQLTPDTKLNATTEYLDDMESAIDAQGKATVIFQQDVYVPDIDDTISGLFYRQVSPAGTAIAPGPIPLGSATESTYLNDDYASPGQIDASPDGHVTIGFAQRQPGCCVLEAQLRTISPDGTLGDVQPISPEGTYAAQVTLAYGPNGGGTVMNVVEPDSGVAELRSFDLTGSGTLDGTGSTLDTFANDNRPYLGTPAVSGNGDTASLWSVEHFDISAEDVHSAIKTVSAPGVSLWAPAKATAGQELILAAEGESRNPLTYAWAIGSDGSPTGKLVRHTFAQPGTYDVKVTVTDSAGKTGSATASIEVLAAGGNNPPPPIAPNTKITKKPAKKTKNKKATFKFISSLAGSKFECRLDKAGWSNCKSPKKLKLRRGKHTLRVRAIKGDLLDKTPAKYTWKVKKAKKKHGKK